MSMTSASLFAAVRLILPAVTVAPLLLCPALVATCLLLRLFLSFSMTPLCCPLASAFGQAGRTAVRFSPAVAGSQICSPVWVGDSFRSVSSVCLCWGRHAGHQFSSHQQGKQNLQLCFSVDWVIRFGRLGLCRLCMQFLPQQILRSLLPCLLPRFLLHACSCS